MTARTLAEEKTADLVVVAQVAGAVVAVETGEGYAVLVECGRGRWQALVQLLGGGQTVKQGGRLWVRIEHSDEVDRVLVDLVDVCAEVRVRCPRAVQLPLLISVE